MANSKQRSNAGHERPGDLSRVKINSAATMEELQEFIGTMKGKNPQEVLGMVAQSGLLKGVLTATIWTTVLMAIFTVWPYMMPAETKTATKKADTTANVPNEVAQDPTKSATDVANQSQLSNQEKGVKMMGLDESKASDPNANPLEKKSDIDNLLDID